MLSEMFEGLDDHFGHMSDLDLFSSTLFGPSVLPLSRVGGTGSGSGSGNGGGNGGGNGNVGSSGGAVKPLHALADDDERGIGTPASGLASGPAGLLTSPSPGPPSQISAPSPLGSSSSLSYFVPTLAHGRVVGATAQNAAGEVMRTFHQPPHAHYAQGRPALPTHIPPVQLSLGGPGRPRGAAPPALAAATLPSPVLTLAPGTLPAEFVSNLGASVPMLGRTAAVPSHAPPPPAASVKTQEYTQSPSGSSSSSGGSALLPQYEPSESVYSASRFDLLGLLGIIANRRNAKYRIGPVDLSCAFTISDPNQDDCPIVYASPSFATLTKYPLHEIIGRNCRFLQAPDGSVVRGSPRQFCDSNSVYQLKTALDHNEECQVRILNYTKHGVPFMNFVTMFPVSLAEGEPVMYYVGLQADISTRALPSITQDIPLENKMSTITYQGLTNLPTARIFDLDKKLIEDVGDDAANDFSWCRSNMDANEFLTQLTLDGIFLYTSPNCSLILGYNEDELLGKSIYDFLHPEDVEHIAGIHASIKESKRLAQSYNRMRAKSGAYVSLLTKFNTFLNPVTHQPQLMLCQNRAIAHESSMQSAAHPPLTMARAPTASNFTMSSLLGASDSGISSSVPVGAQMVKPTTTKLRAIGRLGSPMACASCKTTSSPEWRKGPDGRKSLCNACGLRYAKQVRGASDSVTSRHKKARPNDDSASDSAGPSAARASGNGSSSGDGTPPSDARPRSDARSQPADARPL